MKTVKLSYSILNAWAHPMRQEDAVGMYLGKPLPETPQLTLGKLKHEAWANHILQHRAIPDELGGGDLANPVVEEKYEKIIPLNEDYQILIRGMVDLVDGEYLYDWKCGVGEPAAYVSTMQLDYYKLLLPQVKEGQYRCFNPYNKKVTIGVKYLSEANAEAAVEHILTFGSEMIQYLEANKLLKDYNPNWREEPASQKQLDYLASLGGAITDGMTRGQASEKIDALRKATA